MDYKELYQKKLAKMKEQVVGTKIYEKLEIKSFSNENIDQIIAKMNEVLAPKRVFTDFNFRTGKIFGILRSIAQNPANRQELLAITGLNETHVDTYFEICGNLPYLNAQNEIIKDRPMDVEATKEFIVVVGSILGYVIEESDISDITQERWDYLCKNAHERLNKTIEHNKQYAESVPTEYDE